MKTTPAELLARYIGESHATNPFKIPKYVRAAQVMQRMIEEGHWAPGDQLPPEVEIVRMLDVSLGTAQKALSTLADKGLITREHGRGTFVSGAHVPDEDLLYYRFLAEDGVTRLPISSRALEIARIDAAGPWSEFIEAASGHVRLRRLMSVNHDLDILSEVYVSADRFGEIAGYPLKALHNALMYRLLADRFNAPTYRVSQRMRLRPLPEDATTQLELAAGSVGIVWELFSFGPRNVPLLYQRAYVPPSPYILHTSDMTVSRYQAMANAAI